MQFDEKQRNRASLDAFFVKNAIPSESNFSDLIASGLNQDSQRGYIVFFKPTTTEKRMERATMPNTVTAPNAT